MILLILSECETKYQKINLEPLTEQTKQYQETKNGITIRAKVLDETETKDIFGKNAQKLFTKKRFKLKTNVEKPVTIKDAIVPIQFTLSNNSQKIIHLQEKDINLPLVTTKQVTKRLYYNPAGRIFACIGICIASSIALGLLPTGIGILTVSSSVGTCALMNPAGVLAIYIGAVAAGTFFITATPTTATYQGIKARKANNTISEDIKEKNIKEISIASNQTVSFLLFVPKSYFKSEFDFSVHTLDEKIIFNVNLNQKQNNEFLS